MKTLFYKPPFQSVCAITTNCEILCELISLKYGKYVDCFPENADIEITALKENDHYIITTPSGKSVTDDPLIYIDRYIFTQTKYSKKIFALHGAAVEYGGKCYIFPATTTSGKTTLASYLSLSGFGYLTDDCALIDRNNLTVHPFATPPQVRDGGMEVLKNYGTVPNNVKLVCFSALQHRYIYTPPNVPSSPVPLGGIFFIERTENINRVVKMSTNEKITELMKSPITPYPIDGDYIRFLSRLAMVDCKRLLYCDMKYVKELIENGKIHDE